MKNMEYTHLLALLTFAVVSSFSPGPNNIMLMTSGANVGFYRTIPHIVGVVAGYSIMLLLVGLGLMQFLQQSPFFHNVLQILCLIYLLYLAYRIATSKMTNKDVSQFKPMSLFAAAGFQWINPKGWSMALTAITVYSSSNSNYISAIILITGVFLLVSIVSTSVWTLAGKKCQQLLKNPHYFKIFNYSMASLLLLSVAFTL